ncbi:MAG: nuclear transport factor 2 family protein [Croceitalea sp.]|nr:nuclear transport factor 2 family protein [Croceitalea sp.]MBT8237114.1 nuclear transport factor 2 family protein [Croceitalea sp.]
MNKVHPNMAVLEQLDLNDMVASAKVIEEDFVWHYFNLELPEIHGDYHGIKGFADFFKKMTGTTGGTFKVNVMSTVPMGDDLVVTYVKDTMVLKGKPMEVDAIVVWCIMDGKIKEAWDIPIVHTAKILDT